MAIREIRLSGDEILKKKSREVEIVDDRIREILNDMDETMHQANGVGLSAVQVGVLKKVVVIDVEDGEGARVLINPKITTVANISTNVKPLLFFNFIIITLT